MKKYLLTLAVVMLLAISVATFAGCGLFDANKSGTASDATTYDKEVVSSTGKWYFVDDNHAPTDTYFEFDGTSDIMSFTYAEDATQKFAGTYRVVQPSSTGKDRTYVFSWCLDKKDGEKEDVLYCYADDFSTDANSNFTQFTIMQAVKKLPMQGYDTYDHTYRISEMPYKMGTYVLEDKVWKAEKDEYAYANKYFVPNGTYALSENVSITFFMTKPRTYELFRYKNGDKVVEGVYTVSEAKDAIYLYIQHDPFQKVTKEDKEIYDTTLSIYYPPDFNVHGQFDVSANSLKIVINDFTPTLNAPEYANGFLKTGTYNRV